MPWNEPGTPKNKNQWGMKNNQQPPNLDKLISDFINKTKEALGFNKKENNGTTPPSSFQNHFGLWTAVFVIFVMWVVSGFFIVNPAEEAVVLRFGKYYETLPPGLHWIARFVDTKYSVDVQKIYSFSLQGDFLTKSSEQTDLAVQKTEVSKYTSDQSKNLVNVELNVQYRIQNPRAYLFSVVNPDDTIQEVASGVLSDVIGKMKLDDVLTTGREYVSSGVLERSRKVLNSYNTGIEIVAVTLRKVQAPDQVRAAFNDVNRAEQDKATTIQQAQAYASKVVPLAQGVAARILADANGYQQQVVLTAQANIAKYQALLKVYSVAPEITRERMYLETIQTVLQNTNKVLVDVNSANNFLYLPLDKIFRSDSTPQMASSSSTHNGVKNETN